MLYTLSSAQMESLARKFRHRYQGQDQPWFKFIGDRQPLAFLDSMAAEQENQETALLVVLATVTLLTVYWELFDTRYYKQRHRRDTSQDYSDLVNVTEEDFNARYPNPISRFEQYWTSGSLSKR